MLVSYAVAVFRPHTAGATSQAAFHASHWWKHAELEWIGEEQEFARASCDGVRKTWCSTWAKAGSKISVRASQTRRKNKYRLPLVSWGCIALKKMSSNMRIELAFDFVFCRSEQYWWFMLVRTKELINWYKNLITQLTRLSTTSTKVKIANRSWSPECAKANWFVQIPKNHFGGGVRESDNVSMAQTYHLMRPLSTVEIGDYSTFLLLWLIIG